MSKSTGLLPEKKSEPTLAFDNIKGLLYGAPKVGKSTLASQLADDVLILATEPGLGGLSAFSVDIDSWDTFREVGAELAKTDKHSIVVVDTADELYRMCSAAVCEKLKIDHPSDAEWGKGWQAVKDEFRLRVGKLAGLGRGTWFISHAHEIEIKSRIGSRTKTVPTLNNRGLEFLHGFCDFILYAASEESKDGERRLLHTQATEAYEAGGRYTLPDPLPLSAGTLKREIDKAVKEANK